MTGIMFGLTSETGPTLFLLSTGIPVAITMAMVAGYEYEEKAVALSSADAIGQYCLTDQIMALAMERFVCTMGVIWLIVCFMNPSRTP